MRRALFNIFHLGIKELWGLWRDPAMLVLIAFMFGVSVYTGAKAVPETLNRAPIAIVDEDASSWRRLLDVNLTGAFLGIRAAVPLKAASGGGSIVNTASVAAQDGQIGQAAYSASKGGVYAMTLPIARDLAQEGVRCNTILPGIMWKPMMAGMDQKIQDALAAAIPFPSRLGTPADYASLVLELARNVYINGECIRLDGAIRLAPR